MFPPFVGISYAYLKEINADVEYIHEDIAHEKMIVRMIMDFYKYLYPNQPLYP